MDYSDEFLVIQQQFCAALNPFQNKTFGGKVDLVQIPYASAFNPYTCYAEKYLTKPVPVLFLGLNAAQNGMCTTGIPFGDIDFVLNYLDVTGLGKLVVNKVVVTGEQIREPKVPRFGRSRLFGS